MRTRLDTCCRGLLLLLLLAGAMARTEGAETPAIIRRVALSSHGTQVQVRVVLSRPVAPQMGTATGPQRVLLDLPDTSSSPHQRHITVLKSGVDEVRYGLNHSNPPVTRLVVDLQQPGSCELKTVGNEIVLTITPGASAASNTMPPAARRRHAPPAAANAPWISLSPKENSAEAGATANTPLPSPPASPAQAPPAQPEEIRQSRKTAPAQASSQFAAAAPAVASRGVTQAASSNTSPTTTATQPVNSASAPAAAAPEPALSTRTAPSAAPLEAQPATSAASAAPARANRDIRTVFRVKYVAEGAVYLDGGRADGLGSGVALVIKNQNGQAQPPQASASATSAAAPAESVITAHLKVISVAQNSAVCEVSASTQQVKPGDLAYLTSADAEALVQQRALSSTRVYPQVITFTQGDPMDEEVRDEVPRPPLPEVNRTRLMVGFDYGGIRSRGSALVSGAQYGMVLRTDMTRIGGSYWNLHGYWRGELNSHSATAQPTIQDMMNRTYTIGLTYDNPGSRFVAGVGRLYLPWATSLDVVDGGYGGLRFGKHVTAGLFAGSSPDPTSWSYNPDRRIAGNFVNFEGGSYDEFHYTSTAGMGMSTLLWQIDRPFVFLENGISYKRFVTVYQAMQADRPRGTPAAPSPGAGVSRSYVSVRVQPIQRLSLDFNHNYFRDVPTYNLGLVGTGLLDTVLFQGFSAGARVETVKKIYLYTEQGRSSHSGDARKSWNRMYGVTFARLWNTGLHADLHYATFNSAFAQGNYRAVSLSRNFGDNLQAQVQVGKQAFTSP
ncbi:MAG TPA: AMIN domain-containing protein, partial [Terriglobales bacterium]|nr:AMIN domain-containing protein [Terriglobales bacterium]